METISIEGIKAIAVELKYAQDDDDDDDDDNNNNNNNIKVKVEDSNTYTSSKETEIKEKYLKLIQTGIREAEESELQSLQRETERINQGMKNDVAKGLAIPSIVQRGQQRKVQEDHRAVGTMHANHVKGWQDLIGPMGWLPQFGAEKNKSGEVTGTTSLSRIDEKCFPQMPDEKIPMNEKNPRAGMGLPPGMGGECSIM